MMPLSSGTRLGPYEILAAIGAGGMGEVYKARDTRLDRTVAIKILPAALALDAEFRERFEREARSISALNHPNICTLFDVGQEATASFLVMEYLEGETLAARIERGALPVSDALRIATEIASALDKAHRLGIVHRDLKPGNIMLVKSGGARSDVTQAKLLDFGLAKIGPAGTLSGAAPTALATSPRPTAQALTAQGTILGTFQYMAPEQIEGDEADARSDIFAFGSVLYEMLTGRKAFAGKSQASLLGAILKDEPPAVSQAQPLVPPALDYLVRTCLAKDPDARFQTSHDLLLQLKWIAEGGSAAGVAAPVVAHRRNRERRAWIAAATLGAALVVAATMAVIHLRETAPVVDPIQFTVDAPQDSQFNGTGPQFALSPDGHQVVFVASRQGVPVLWIRPLSTTVAQPLPGTEWAGHPFWSPDSRFIGFFAAGRLKTVQVAGGAPVDLCDAPIERGGTWNSDNVILFSPTVNSPLMRVTLAGGTFTPVTELAKGETSHRWPTFLPDGHHYLYFVGVGDNRVGEIRVGSLDSKETVAVVASDSNGLYASGHVLFVRGGNLMALPFNPGTRQSTGDAFPLAGQISLEDTAYAALSVSATNVLAYAHGTSRRTARLTRFDLAGNSLGTVGDPDVYINISLSPDERRVAVSLHTGSPSNRDIWLINFDRAGARERFTYDPAAEVLPVWSHDGTQVAFGSNRNGPMDIYVKAVRDSGPEGKETLTSKSASAKYVTDWSRDGRFLAYTEQAASSLDVWVLPLSGDRKPISFVQTPFSEDNAVFSPDGHWIAYDSNESGHSEVYVKPFPGPGGRYKVSRNGGMQPIWRGNDGRELFFLTLDGTLMSADVSTAKDFAAGVPKALFPMGVTYSGNLGYVRHQYAVTSDGKQFLVIVAEQRTAPITVAVNWLPARQK